eukprot:3654040-Amphidinium_carterae.1
MTQSTPMKVQEMTQTWHSICTSLDTASTRSLVNTVATQPWKPQTLDQPVHAKKERSEKRDSNTKHCVTSPRSKDVARKSGKAGIDSLLLGTEASAHQYCQKAQSHQPQSHDSSPSAMKSHGLQKSTTKVKTCNLAANLLDSIAGNQRKEGNRRGQNRANVKAFGVITEGLAQNGKPSLDQNQSDAR